jgi:GTP-binding protein HflX
VILPASGEAVIADTVGFIQDLPHDLVAAFKSTLEEKHPI